MTLENSTLSKHPIEVLLMIFKYALEELRCTEERHAPTYNGLLRGPTREFHGRKFDCKELGCWLVSHVIENCMARHCACTTRRTSSD
jgi:hypothetical protein